MRNAERTEHNRALVTRWFEARETGNNKPFVDALVDDLQWTVMGSCCVSKRYADKRAFIEVFKRIGSQLKERLQVKTRRIIADGDWVTVLWDGFGQTNTGEPYDNQYCWVLRLQDERIVEVLAYIDTALIDRLFAGAFE